MTIELRRPALLLSALAGATLSLNTEVCKAQESLAPSFTSYGVRGFSAGAGIGLASATLWARSSSNANARGFASISLSGAVAGTIAGTALAFVDTDRRKSYVGYRILSGVHGGTWVGAFAGVATGGVLWLNGGRAISMLDGAATGSLIGAGVGLAYGLVSALADSTPPPSAPTDRSVYVTVSTLAAPTGQVPALVASGTF